MRESDGGPARPGVPRSLAGCPVPGARRHRPPAADPHRPGCRCGWTRIRPRRCRCSAWRGRRSPARRRFWYSNPGYQALGMLLERLTGEPYRRRYRSEILEPLGMASSEPDIRNELRPRLAVGHSPADDERPWHPATRWCRPPGWSTPAADGSVCCTPADLAAYARMLLAGGDGVLSEQASPADDHALRRLRRRHRLRLRAGRAPRADGWIGHSGGMVGYHAQMWIDPAAGRAAVGFSNGLRGQRQLVERALGGRRAGPGGAGRHRPPGDLRRRAACRVARAARHLPLARPLDDLPRGRHARRQAAGRPGRRGAGADAGRGRRLPGRRRGVEPRAAPLRHRGGRRRHAGAAQHLAATPGCRCA